MDQREEEVGIEIPTPAKSETMESKIRPDIIRMWGALGGDFRIVGQAMDFSLVTQ